MLLIWNPMQGHGKQDLDALLEEYGHILRRAIRGVAGSHPCLDPDEVEQEARIRVWRALRRKGSLQQPGPYLYRIAISATFDALRRLKARREEPLAVVEGPKTVPFRPQRPSPERAAMDRQQLDRIRSALDNLPINRRRAVRLHLQGFTTTEIGRLRGWTEAKARNLVYRGLADLRGQLEEEFLEMA